MKALLYHMSPARWAACKLVGAAWKGAYVGSLSPIRLADVPVPALPGPEWVRVRTLLGGVCGTDLALIFQRHHPATILQRFARFPAVLGHENVGVIEEVGPGVSGWSAGQRVCVEPALGCEARGRQPVCGQCAAGCATLCEHPGDGAFPPRALIGLNDRTGGSWAEFFVAHRSQLHAVPEGVPDAVAVLTDPVASALHAVLRRPPRDGETVLVNGSGLIALGVIAAIRALGRGNRVVAVVRHAFQAELAERLGADAALRQPRGMTAAARYDEIAGQTGGVRLAGRFGNQALLGGFHLTYDCTGTGVGLTDAMKWTAARGTVVAVGTSGISIVDTTPLWFDELEVIGANGRQIERHDGRSVHTYDLALEWSAAGRLDLSGLPVTAYPLHDYRTALRDLVSRGRRPIVKAAFRPGE